MFGKKVVFALDVLFHMVKLKQHKFAEEDELLTTTMKGIKVI